MLTNILEFFRGKKEEFDALEEYFKKNYHWYNQEKDKALGLSISGMEIVIEN